MPDLCTATKPTKTKPQPPARRFRSIAEGAALLGYNKSTVYRLIAAGALAAPVHIGGRRMWTPDQWERMERGEFGSPDSTSCDEV
jgi:predicted DNA-binding transcriptional regulator AlpA